MNVSIDREGCIGCGLCADICPDVFRMDPDNKAEAHGAPSDETASAVAEAAESCPVSVIFVE